MKSINQIFVNDREILENSAVQELIEYCRDLEEELIESRQVKKASFEVKLSVLVNEIYDSVNQILKESEESERFRDLPKVNFKEAIKNLKNYFQEFSKDNHYYFN